VTRNHLYTLWLGHERVYVRSRERTRTRVSYIYIRSIEERWNDVAMWCNILLRCTNGRDFAAEQRDVGLMDSAALAVITRAEYSLAAWFRHVLIPPRDWIPI